jgi:hypothetical protein
MKKQTALVFDEVCAIEPVGEVDMYDFVIPDTHCFFANGVLVHNSGSIEEDADMVLLLHRPELYDKCKPEDKGYMFVKLAKDRQGGRDDTVRLKWYAKQRHYGVPAREEE